MNYSYGRPSGKYWPEGTNASFVCGKFFSIAGNVTIFLAGNDRQIKL